MRRLLILALLSLGAAVAADQKPEAVPLEREDALELENRALSAQLLAERIDRMRAELERVKAEFEAKRREVLAKLNLPESEYSIDLAQRKAVKRAAPAGSQK